MRDCNSVLTAISVSCTWTSLTRRRLEGACPWACLIDTPYTCIQMRDRVWSTASSHGSLERDPSWPHQDVSQTHPISTSVRRSDGHYRDAASWERRILGRLCFGRDHPHLAFQIWVIFTSHSSKTEFLNNASNSFKIRLPHPIRLEGGGWEMGLVAVSLPDPTSQVPPLMKDNNVVMFWAYWIADNTTLVQGKRVFDAPFNPKTWDKKIWKHWTG